MTSPFVPSESTPPPRSPAACRTCPKLRYPRRRVVPLLRKAAFGSVPPQRAERSAPIVFRHLEKVQRTAAQWHPTAVQPDPLIDHSDIRQEHLPPGFARIPAASRHGRRRSADHVVASKQGEGHRSTGRSHTHSRQRADSPRRYGPSPREDSRGRRVPKRLPPGVRYDGLLVSASVAHASSLARLRPYDSRLPAQDRQILSLSVEQPILKIGEIRVVR